MLKVSMQDWEITLKKSIINNYYEDFGIQNCKEDKSIDLLIKALSILRKENQRKGEKVVYFSKELENNPLYVQFENDIQEIKYNYENGLFEQNFKRLSERHRINATYRDTMLDVLNVEHLHFKTSDNEYNKSKELLFVKYLNNEVYFIDIFTHNNFLDDSIIQILHNNWENTIATFKFKSDIQLVNEFSNKSRYRLYKKNINSVYEIIDGNGQKHCYAAFGIMSNGDAMQDTRYAQFLQREIMYFQDNIDFFSNIIYRKLLEFFQKSFSELNFSVVWLANFGVCFVEVNSNMYFVLQENEVIFLDTQKLNENCLSDRKLDIG